MNPQMMMALANMRRQGTGRGLLGLAGLINPMQQPGMGSGMVNAPMNGRTNPGMPGMTPGTLMNGRFTPPQGASPNPQMLMGGGWTGGRDNPRQMMMQRFGGK